MRRFSFKRTSDHEQDMTPMVDVTFLLLIFFMVTASFSLQKTLAMPRAPQDAAMHRQDDLQEEPIEIHVDSFGSFTVVTTNGETETPSKRRMVTVLRQAIESDEAQPVRIMADEAVKLRFLVDAIDRAKSAGAVRISVQQVDGFTP